MHATLPRGLLRRPIPGTPHADGYGPWPYMWVDCPDDVEAFVAGYGDLVTLALVTRPGFVPPAGRWDAILLKEHYLFDPDQPLPPFSKRTRDHLRRSRGRWTFGTVDTVAERMEMKTLYDHVRRRRQLSGGFFDFPDAHFERLARNPRIVFFGARNADGLAAMACGAMIGERLQLLHIAASDAGLRDEAVYTLMPGIIDLCRHRHLLLMLAGKPDRDGDGIGRFKARWSNRTEPVHLLRIVNRRDIYDQLTAGSAATGFFPAYRQPM
ncbi:MAG: hypothetical protein KDK07_05765 [Bauldia sp.]|nr:hypothetical protein [Bauldia sp.]